MLFSLFLLCIFAQIRPALFAECKINKEYRNLVLSTSTIVLCTDATCSTNIEVLTHNVIYASCKLGSNTFPLRIQIATFQSHTIKTIRCLTKNGWILKNDNYLCDAFSNLVFKSYPTMAESDFYVVGCDDQETEFPNSDAPRLQISGYEGFQDKGVTPEFLFFPTYKVSCVSNCQETIPILETNNADVVRLAGKFATIKTTIPDTEYSKLITISCTSSVSVTRIIPFYVANQLNASIFTNIGRKTRSPEFTFDVGEVLSCSVTGRNTFKSVTGQPPSSSISLVELDQNLNILTVTVKNKLTSLTLPENLKLIKHSFGIICHFGLYKSAIPDSYFLIQKWKINIGAKFLTKIQYVTGNVPIQDYNIIPKSNIKCDDSYYNRKVAIPIFILYGKLVRYPRSELSNYENTKFDNATGDLYFEKKFHGRQMFAFCMVDDQITAPVDIFAGDKPEMNIVYVHPKWKSEYHFGGFIFICNSTNVEEISLMCLDCLPDTRMDISKVNPNQMKLAIPKTLRKNSYITYKCTGVSTKYSDVSELIKLKVIVSERTNIDTSNDILLYGISHLSCVSTFTIFSKNSAVTESIRLPPHLKIDNGPIINEDGSAKFILLQKASSPYIRGDEKVVFTGCCPVFFKDNYICTDEWREIYVARSISIDYNLDLNNLYPGNMLKCYICAEYTFEITSSPCTGIHRVNTFIRLKIKHPDGITRYTTYEEEVQVPREGLKPDKKSFYKISEYEIYVQCKVNYENKTKQIFIKSCNTNPPAITISPPDKSMFVAGEIISCTSESLHCRNGLTYIIYVQTEGQPVIRKEMQSFSLSKKHIGNNVKIKCTAGEGERSKAERVIRVEMEPYNVSINILKPMMIYRKYLRCTAYGFPPPSVTWSQTEGPSSLMISEHFLLIGPWDFSGNYTIHCEAKNERGTVTKTASFAIFNPRISNSDYSIQFYLLIPLLTLGYIAFLILSLLVIFQENVFGVPFFSGGSAGQSKSEKKEATTEEENKESTDKEEKKK